MPERDHCGSLMVGSGGDTYDPICVLPHGHAGGCKSPSAIDQNRLRRPAYGTPFCPCGGRFQIHPMSDDLGVCAECGNEWAPDDASDERRDTDG
jgi:hypothetical protein